MPVDDVGLFPEIGVGLVGGGFMSQVHARAARAAGAQLLGVASRTGDGAARARGALGAAKAYASFDDMLADDRIQIVHVCTPNRTHPALAAAAIAAGKHVICEKPLATSAADAAELVRVVSGADRVATVPFVYRFHPMVREARARVADGRTGRIFSIHGSYLQDWLASPDDDDWRVDPRHGGPSRAFADIGSHLCDLLEFVTSDRISGLSARTRTVHPDRASNKNVATEDVATVVFEMGDGAVGTLHISQVAPGHKNWLTFEIDAERQTLSFDQERPEVLRVGTRAGFLNAVRSTDIAPEAARYSVVPAGHPQGYQDAFNAFAADTYRAVRGASPDGLPGFADGHRAAVLTEAVLESARTGRWVDTSDRSPALVPTSWPAAARRLEGTQR